MIVGKREWVCAVGFVVLLGMGAAACAVGNQPRDPALMASLPTPLAARRSTDDELRKLHVNEVGRIPIVMYHSVGDPGKIDRLGLNIAPSTFRKHLQLMYEAGWYPMNMRDILKPQIDVPAGKTPVVLTFDDGRGSQFHQLASGAVDPKCALGIMMDFNRQHPDWPLRGTFYVLTRRANPIPFYQRGKEGAKLNRLIDLGFEIGNHSSSHGWMNRMSDAKLQFEVADCIRYIKKLAPRATMDTFCLPYGARPRKPGIQVLLEGAEGGTSYRNLCVLNAWGGPALPFTHKRFDAGAVDRVGVDPGILEGWLKRLKPGKSMEPYISDGNPNTMTVGKAQAKWIARERLGGAQLRVYDDGSAKPAKVKKAAVTSKG
jgi:peptidoglycan/xylan/chitin deacetylase (PgdA/CDA1 family)